MEGLEFLKVLEVVSQFGLSGVILVLWYTSDRAMRHMLDAYREDTMKVLSQYGQHMGEQRRMYENNAELVRGYNGFAGDLKDVVMINTQAMTRLSEAISHNQFCPMVRLEKRAEGKVPR